MEQNRTDTRSRKVFKHASICTLDMSSVIYNLEIVWIFLLFGVIYMIFDKINIKFSNLN